MTTLYAHVPHPPQIDAYWNDGTIHEHQHTSPIEVTVKTASSEGTLLGTGANQIERILGDTELSYFLPSRESGVNDMYLHLGCRAVVELLDVRRIRLVWAILRIRHPLLASRVEMHDYDDARFVYLAPCSVENALSSASANIGYRTQNKDELINSYLNGPRMLSNERLSYLIVSRGNVASSLQSTDGVDCNFLICATHFLGDGMALHQFANDFFCLLGGSSTTNQLAMLLSSEWLSRCAKVHVTLPAALEDRLPLSNGKLCRLVSRIDFDRSQEKLVGGHTFPRHPGSQRHTVVPTISIDVDRTKKLLKNCKAHGVSISSALFALCNIAWAKTSNRKWELPTMMYSALNLRPYLVADTAINDSYWYLAIGYFNVVLPSFLPTTNDISSTFWHRARTAKAQSINAAKNPMAVSRSREMARVRGERARIWAKDDDNTMRGIKITPACSPKKPSNRPPSDALIGLSLLGNLDGIYNHSAFPGVQFHTLTTGSRQRSGGMLLFGYTFVGKLWLSLGYDENGFDRDTVRYFWDNMLSCIDELLIK
ncbi:hypothetical protein BDZ94DRAFT_35159 [Collybia nuda]|uniref:Acyltransferase n=1 Tax=Collybia nuda TaxID=64659 RepID=A0A9P6CKR7_9AGAR|nr:hypothetical protein BDZ94DRAFT_35159 [Collybia nuda]